MFVGIIPYNVSMFQVLRILGSFQFDLISSDIQHLAHEFEHSHVIFPILSEDTVFEVKLKISFCHANSIFRLWF